MNWLPIATAPRDGTKVRLKWRKAEDAGFWDVFQRPQEVWADHPDMAGMDGEWSTDFGNAERDEYEPQGWLPMTTDSEVKP